MAMEEQYLSVFDVVDRATAPLRQITQAFQGGQMAIQRTTALLNPLNAALGLIGAGLSFDKMLDIGSKFENQVLKMAQTAKLMGMGGETFADATATARDMIKQVNVAAAALPGEAEDYSTALEMAGFTVQQATGNYEKTFSLVKDITAITIANQRSAAESANQLNKMLNADRGLLELQNDYSMKLIQNMRSLPGYANLTTTAFNNLKLEERTKLVGQLASTYKDMLDASSDTLDAIKGASMTMFKEITRQASAPLFDGWKDGLKAVNALFMQADGALTPLSEKIVHVGNVLSTKVVEGVKALGSLSLPQAGGLIGALGGLGSGGMSAVMGGGLGAGAAAIAPIMLAGATLGELATRTEFVSTVVSQFGQILGMATGLLAPLEGLFSMLTTNLADLVEGVLPGVLSGLNMIVDPVVEFGTAIFGIIIQIGQQLRPTLMALWGAIGNLFSAIGSFAMPILRFFGIGLYTLFSVVKDDVVPIFAKLWSALSDLINWIADKLRWLGAQLNWGLTQMGYDPNARGQRAENAIDKLLGAFRTPEGGAIGAPRAPQAPNKRATTGMVQDFRFSRFEISQKFEEGYDPDRIAVAFANDLGKLGEQRSQSGFAPLFSVGI